MTSECLARFSIGDVVRHRLYPFRGVIVDVDATFNNTEEWWLSIPEDKRPRKEQPYYQAYVSEQNLLPDETGQPCRHPLVGQLFDALDDGHYSLKRNVAH
jgi:heat shock protein HspQ